MFGGGNGGVGPFAYAYSPRCGELGTAGGRLEEGVPDVLWLLLL